MELNPNDSTQIKIFNVNIPRTTRTKNKQVKVLAKLKYVLNDQFVPISVIAKNVGCSSLYLSNVAIKHLIAKNVVERKKETNLRTKSQVSLLRLNPNFHR